MICEISSSEIFGQFSSVNINQRVAEVDAKIRRINAVVPPEVEHDKKLTRKHLR
jgi:hypothetical protein